MATYPQIADSDDDIDLSAGMVPHPPTHPAGRVTAFDEETGLPIVKRHTRVERTPHSVSVERETVEKGPAKHPETGRDILHGSKDRATLVNLAKKHASSLESGLKEVAKSVPGAHFDAVRSEKTPERLTEKIEKENQPIETIPDILAGRLKVDTPEAHHGAASAIQQHFDVVRDQDEFDKGDEQTGYRVHKLQVKMSPELSAEVHIVPKEIAAVNDKQHDAYDKMREAALEAKELNDGAMEKFEDRNGAGETNAPKGETKKPETETKYKHGNTQANLPKGSDAHKAVLAAQGKINDADLMGDGKDVDDPHITVRYGLDGDTSGVKKYLSQQKPFIAKLGKTTSFPPSENSDGAAPIIAPVESDDLHRMNAEIQKHGTFAPSSFPEYKPHVTVAYVKPEAAKKYEEMTDTEGKSFPVKSVSISDQDGNKEDVPLDGSGNPQNDAQNGKAALKVGDHVTLADGRSATVAYVPGKNSQIPTYRFTTSDGKTVNLRAKQVENGVKPADKGGYVAVDFDGTLAKQMLDKSKLGPPVPKMLERVKRMLKNGEDVRILTAKIDGANGPEMKKKIEDWCRKYIGQVLPVTNRKDEHVKAIFDDRAVQVARNDGTILGSHRKARGDV